MNQFLLLSILLALAACATPSPGPDRSESMQVPESVETSESVEVNEPADDDLLAQNKQAEVHGGIESVDTPNVSEIPPEMIPGIAAPEAAVVCERTVPTGSVLRVKVCRHKAEIERKQEADQRIFDDIKRNTAVGASRY